MQEPVATYSGAAYPIVPITWVDMWVQSPVGPSIAMSKPDNLVLKSCNPCNDKWVSILPTRTFQNLMARASEKLHQTYAIQKNITTDISKWILLSMYDGHFQVVQEDESSGNAYSYFDSCCPRKSLMTFYETEPIYISEDYKNPHSKEEYSQG